MRRKVRKVELPSMAIPTSLIVYVWNQLIWSCLFNVVNYSCATTALILTCGSFQSSWTSESESFDVEQLDHEAFIIFLLILLAMNDDATNSECINSMIC